MYCPECKCEYSGWNAKCPGCVTNQSSAQPHDAGDAGELIAYDSLVQLVGQSGGRLDVALTTTEHGSKKKQTFPYFGHGYAWAKRLEGSKTEVEVDLAATEVVMQTRKGFPYIGRGYAWVERAEGYLGGNSLTLSATDVAKEKKWAFPYTGFGRAWTERMAGTCGDRLRVDLKTTKVARDRSRGFPYVGFGFAWVSEATLTLTLEE